MSLSRVTLVKSFCLKYVANNDCWSIGIYALLSCVLSSSPPLRFTSTYLAVHFPQPKLLLRLSTIQQLLNQGVFLFFEPLCAVKEPKIFLEQL